MKFQLSKLFFLSLALGLFLLPSCVKTEFDEPPVLGNELEVKGNTTIAELKSRYVPGRLTEIEEGVIVQGVIVGNDISGNFFRTLIMQDSTAGITVLINLTDAFNLFPLGREIAIDCSGFFLGEFNGTIQLGEYTYKENGADQLGNIINYNERMFRGRLGQEPAPIVRTLASLGPNDISTLVQIDAVEFASFELGQTYADVFGLRTLNRTLQDCDGNEAVVRTSGFATFAGDTIPSGNGSIKAIYSVFGNTKQLLLRTEADAAGMTGTRCSAGTGEEELMSIQALREVANGGAEEAPDERKIRGIVISDKDNGNTDVRNIVIQDNTAGIVVRFQNEHNFRLGDELEVVVSRQELSFFNGLMQLSFVNNDLATSSGPAASPLQPREATINDVLENLDFWESTLVKINNVSLTGGATFGGARNASDGTANIDLFTRNGATFASAPLPTEPVETMTAIVSRFNGAQLLLRNLEDVGGETTGGGDPTQISLMELRDLFNGGTGSAPVNRFVRGTVISDGDAGNTVARNMVIQDETGGIVIRFSANHSFSLNEDVQINVSALELSQFNGLLQVNNVPNANATSFGNTTPPTPRDATIQEVTSNAEAWESTLVKIAGATFTAGGTFAGEKTLQDGTGSIPMFTRNDATFANSTMPTDAFTITGIVSDFNGVQLLIRNLNDIEQ